LQVAVVVEDSLLLAAAGPVATFTQLRNPFQEVSLFKLAAGAKVAKLYSQVQRDMGIRVSMVAILFLVH
jgi:hypothetical protein